MKKEARKRKARHKAKEP